MIRLNLITPMLLTMELGPYLEKSAKAGVIINISSCAGRDAVAHQAGYSASKWCAQPAALGMHAAHADSAAACSVLCMVEAL